MITILIILVVVVAFFMFVFSPVAKMDDAIDDLRRMDLTRTISHKGVVIELEGEKWPVIYLDGLMVSSKTMIFSTICYNVSQADAKRILEAINAEEL